MKRLWIFALIAPAGLFSPALAAVITTFETGLEGWTFTNTVPPTPTWNAAGGNPNGWVFVDNNEGAAAFAVAPASYLGNLLSYSGGTIRFDAILLTGNGQWSNVNDFGNVVITGPNGTARADLAPEPTPVGMWLTFSAPFTAAAFGLTQTQWDILLSNVMSFSISLESTFGAETNGIDNVMLLSSAEAIPEPAVSLLVAGGLIGIWLLKRCG